MRSAYPSFPRQLCPQTTDTTIKCLHEEGEVHKYTRNRTHHARSQRYNTIHPSLLSTVCFFVILCLCVCVCVCTVTDFSAEDKASGFKFCTAVHRRPRHGISHFGQLCSPEAQNRRANRPARAVKYK